MFPKRSAKTPGHSACTLSCPICRDQSRHIDYDNWRKRVNVQFLEEKMMATIAALQSDAGSKNDATGLVPHYRDVSEVPEHLQKCEPTHFVPILNAKRAISKFPSTRALLFIVLDAPWVLAG